MPEEKKPLSNALSSANAALEQTNAIIRQIEAIKAAAGGGKTELVVTTKVQGAEEAASAVEKSAARQVTALSKVKGEAVAAGQAVDQVSRPRTTARAAAPVSRIDRTTSQAFIDENKRAIDLLNRTSREPDIEVRKKQYARYGLSTNLADEAEKIRVKREQLDSLKRLREAASSGDDEEIADAIHTYNKSADPAHKYDPRLNASELDLRAGNEIGSLGRQVADRQRALAYRVARDRGAIRDKSNLTNTEVRARIQQMIKVVGTEPKEGGIADVDALARSFITVHRGDVPGYIQAQIKAGELPLYEKLDTRTGAEILADIQEKYRPVTQAGRAEYLTPIKLGQGESPLGGKTVARGRAYQELLRPIRAKQAAEAKAAARAQRAEDKVAAEKAKQEMLQEPGYVPAEEEVPAEPAPELPVRLRGVAKLNALRAKLVQRYPNIFGILGNRKGFLLNPFARSGGGDPLTSQQGGLFGLFPGLAGLLGIGGEPESPIAKLQEPSPLLSQATVKAVGPRQFEVHGYRAQPAYPSQPSLVEMQRGITSAMLSDEAMAKLSKSLDPLFFPAALRGLQRGTTSQQDLRDLFQIGGERSAKLVASLEGAGFTSGVQGPRGQEFIATRGDLVAFKMELERATAATHGFGDAAINTARTAAGLPNAPPVVGGAGVPPGGAGRGFYMPGRGLYGPGVVPPTGTGGTKPGTGFYMPNRGVYGPGVIYPVAEPINARLPGDWLGGGGAPPVGYGGGPAPGFGGGGDEGGPTGPGGKGRGGILGALGGRFKSLALYTAAASVIYPIMAGIRQSLHDAAELEVVLKRIQGIYGSHTLGEQLTIKREIIGTAIQFSANLLETARTAQLLAQEQIPIEKLAQNLKAIAQGAVGLGISQEALANYVISIRNVTAPDVKPLEGPELVNLISAFVRRGAVSSQNLLTSIQQIVPILETFSPNQSPINDPALIASITSVIARRSSFTGAQVANTIKYMISRFGNPDVVRDIEQRAQIGLGTKESGGQELRPFIEILQDLSNAYQHLIDTGQGAAAQNLLKDLFGARQAGVGEILLTNFKTAISEADTAMKDYGASAELASGQQDTFNKSMERLKTVFTSKFAAPAQEGLFSPFIKGLADDLEELSDQFDDVIGKIGQFIIAQEAIDKRLGYDRPAAFYVKGGIRIPVPAGTVEATPKTKYPRPPLPVDKRPGFQGNLATLLGGAQASYLQNLAILTGGQEIKDQIDSKGGVNLYSDKEFKDFYNNFYVKRVQLLAGQQQAALDFGASFSNSKRNLSELTNELERFYQAIHIGERDIGETFEHFVARKTGKDTATAKQMIDTHNELVRDLGKAYEAEKRRLAGVSIITQAGRLEESTARAQDQTDRIRRRLVRTYGRRGLDQYPIQVVQNELEDIARSRIFDIQRENAAYALRVTLLQKSPEFQEKATKLQQAELDDLLREHQTNLDILDVQSRELSIQAEINGLYESRLKDLNEIEKVSNNINDILQQSIAGLPGQSRATGFFGRALASILVPASSSLFRTLVNQIKLTGQGGLFPSIGAALAKVVGAPSNLKTVQVPLVGRARDVEGLRAEALSSVATLAGVVGGGRATETKEVQKSAEELRKEQRAAALRALLIAGASTLGAAAGRGGVGAQTGAQLGAIGGFALGAKIGGVAGPIGAVAGGLLGGLFGGLFDKKKPKPPELIALEKIAANTGESVTLLENTNRLLELQSIAFNVPTGFALPRFQPTVFGGSSLTGGQVPVTTNLNINVSVDGAAGSPQQLGAIIAQAVSDRLESEYSSGGRYVARGGY